MVAFLRGRGVSEKTSRLVIDEFSPEQLLRAHLEHGLGIDEGQVANPWIAAGSSCLSFSLGASLPLLAMLLAPAGSRIPVTFFAVLAGLVLTGWLSANLGQAGKRAAVIRLVAGGALAMAATYGIGQLLGTTIS